VHGKNKMRWYADWIRRQIAKLGVEVKYASVPKPEELKKYDAVLVATGASVKRPDIRGVDSGRVCTYEDVLRCKMKNCEYWPKGGKAEPAAVGDTVLVWGDYYGAADAVEKLAYDGKKVYVVTPHKEFAPWMEPCHKDVMVKRFAGGNGEALTGRTFAHPVTVIAGSAVLEIRDNGEVVLVDGKFERSVLKVDNVVLGDVQADDALYRSYTAAGLVVVKIGDVKKVRNLRGAVTDGANLGLALDKDLQLNANRAVIADLPTDAR
jgi:thioredoxin reductase